MWVQIVCMYVAIEAAAELSAKMYVQTDTRIRSRSSFAQVLGGDRYKRVPCLQHPEKYNMCVFL